MSFRTLGALLLAVTLSTNAASGQSEPVSNGHTLSEWIADLKAPAPVSRNAAAYEIAGMGPAAAAAVPALIEALDDEVAAVRFPVTVALGEIGPAAEAAIPRLKQVVEDDLNDEVAASARRAIKRIRPSATPPE
jgi:HEAT repeat protein